MSMVKPIEEKIDEPILALKVMESATMTVLFMERLRARRAAGKRRNQRETPSRGV